MRSRAEAEQATKVWKAKPATAEVNKVPEQDSWRAEAEAPNKDLITCA